MSSENAPRKLDRRRFRYALHHLGIPADGDTIVWDAAADEWKLGQGGGSGSGSSLIHQASVTLDDDQIKNWPTYQNGVNELQIVPGAGSGTILVLTPLLWLTFYPALADYGNEPGLHLFVGHAAHSGQGFQLGDWLNNGFLAGGYGGGAGTDFGAFHSVDIVNDYLNTNSVTRGQIENVGITLSGGSTAGTPLSGGDPGNMVIFAFEFRVWSLSLRRFLTVAESGWNESTRSFA